MGKFGRLGNGTKYVCYGTLIGIGTRSSSRGPWHFWMTFKLQAERNLGVAAVFRRIPTYGIFLVLSDSLFDQFGLEHTWGGACLRDRGTPLHLHKCGVLSSTIEFLVDHDDADIIGYSGNCSCLRSSIADRLDDWLTAKHISHHQSQY